MRCKFTLLRGEFDINQETQSAASSQSGTLKEFGFTMDKLYAQTGNVSRGFRSDATYPMSQFSEHKITRIVWRFAPRIRSTTFVLNQALPGNGTPQYFGKVITAKPPLPLDFSILNPANVGREEMLMMGSARTRSMFRPFQISCRPYVVESRTIMMSSDGSVATGNSYKPVPYGWQTNGQGYSQATYWPRTGWAYVWMDASDNQLGTYQMDQFFDTYCDVYVTFRGRKTRYDSALNFA